MAGDTQEELTCKELVELVTAYLEGALDPPARARFEQHLAECPGCQTYVEQMRTTIRVLGALTEDAIEPEASNALLSVFRDWKRSPSPRP
ncbi:MAG TPA: zf-HC2 domain-containing protein [Chloroflexia bacterium]|nr:zf-HC2 domain-containing protein [Chloroflexia bacterium]